MLHEIKQGIVFGTPGRSRGIHIQRNRLREAINTVDPRCQYSVCVPISLSPYVWYVYSACRHIDGHHKLIRWRLVIHGGVDEYSRLIVYLNCSSNNKAKTVLDLFEAAVATHGQLLRVWSDFGTENVGVARFMLNIKEVNRGSMITRKSVHNQRIEHLWGEVKRVVV